MNLYKVTTLDLNKGYRAQISILLPLSRANNFADRLKEERGEIFTGIKVEQVK